MSLTDVGMIFKFLGGLGMFLYGMDLMAKGLQQSAGGKMKTLLGVLTNNRLMGVLAGALLTAVIQSSSATTVMVVGFVNAGLMSLAQAVGVIMGANIGTTVTSWLVSMNEWASALKPEFFAPLLLGIGALLLMFSKKERKKMAGEILVGFGILFIGLSFMSDAISLYKDAPIFSDAFQFIGKYPILGILVGTVVTGIIQSSSASVGILQTLAMNGVVNWNAAVFITLGQNIGTCVTALIASAGAHRNAKRAAVIHLLFNVIGAIIFGIIGVVVFSVYPAFGSTSINSVEISIFHTVFNVVNTVILFPFANKLVSLAEKILPPSYEEQQDPVQAVQQRLAEYRVETPTFALEAATHEVLAMGAICLDNTQMALKALGDMDEDAANTVLKNEQVIDELDKILTDFLVRVNGLSLNEKQALQLRNLMYTINDLERIGDHAENLAELAQVRTRNNVAFSSEALQQLKQMGDTVMEALENAFLARSQTSPQNIKLVNELEDKVDAFEEQFREDHIDRLNRGECTTAAGVLFLDALANLERICDHAENVAGYVEAENQPAKQKAIAEVENMG